MTDILYALGGLVIGLVLGGLAAWVAMLSRRGRDQSDLVNARTRAELLDEQMGERLAELAAARRDLDEIRQQREAAERNVAALTEKLQEREKKFAEQEALLKQAKAELGDAFTALGAKALQSNNAQFLKLAETTFKTLMTEARGDVEKKQQAIDALVKPIRELLEKQNAAVGEMEKKREVAYTGIEEQIKAVLLANEKLDRQTDRLVNALRRPEQRGRWGELQLRNVVELAGMTRYCDFVEQPQTDDPATRDRPDMIVNLPGGGVIVVDSKVALDAYLSALDTEGDRTTMLAQHAEQVQQHYRNLASKRYWEQFEHTPKLVVMFMPLESALVAALEIDPDLHAEAMQSHVLIATPTLLVALLRAVAYGWQQEAIAANARDIAAVGRELYERLAVFVKHLAALGSRLDQASESYNRAVGSLESRVLPSTRKLKELGATTREEIDGPGRAEIETRRLDVGELKGLPGAEDAPAAVEPDASAAR